MTPKKDVYLLKKIGQYDTSLKPPHNLPTTNENFADLYELLFSVT